MAWNGGFSRLLTAAFLLATASGALAAEDDVWRVGKSSGEVWMNTPGAQQASLTQEEVLKPGDTIRTGRNGRVLLLRGEETILVSPNSVIGLPTEKKDGLSTTILQQAGSILLEVEKRNVKHFEVETPYLAAVVKGTQFRVSVNAGSTSVDVLRGQVEVADFKSGQIAQVMQGQHATAFAHGKPGLSLSGSGALNPIEQGKPRPSLIERIMVPKTGLSAPLRAANGLQVHALGHLAAGNAATKPAGMRIAAPLGDVRLNFLKVTHGLAHAAVSAPGSTKHGADKDTIWNSHEAKASTGIGNGNSNDTSGSASAVASTSAATNSRGAAQVAATTAAAVNSGNSNGNSNGNGNANGVGANGNANGSGNGNANGNGNGNAYAYGHNKK
ncbi:FecR family protein [Bradyrhizobium erythrophlei]|uniref:FecR family protein n=1 Tax=Bradyrhizobium erythrophlei TaxID=1437360 RepID=A0A1M5UYY5_9BRAD|nr:FecR family protein [Bradyrhizobium erythrophlei]SHH68257.1 FecR family protein [Bradyrhizobium erythrophlei]